MTIPKTTKISKCRLCLNKEISGKKYYLVTINMDINRNDIFKNKKILKIVSAGKSKNTIFYKN